MKTCFTSTHLPSPSVCARAFTYASTSPIVCMSGMAWSNSTIAAAEGWTWESISPGRTVLPPRSSRAVFSPFVASTSASLPAATTLPPSTAIAWWTENAGSAVMILPWWTIRSGGAQCNAAVSSNRTRAVVRVWRMGGWGRGHYHGGMGVGARGAVGLGATVALLLGLSCSHNDREGQTRSELAPVLTPAEERRTFHIAVGFRVE